MCPLSQAGTLTNKSTELFVSNTKQLRYVQLCAKYEINRGGGRGIGHKKLTEAKAEEKADAVDWAAAAGERQLPMLLELAVADAKAEAVPPPEAVADARASVLYTDHRVGRNNCVFLSLSGCASFSRRINYSDCDLNNGWRLTPQSIQQASQLQRCKASHLCANRCG